MTRYEHKMVNSSVKIWLQLVPFSKRYNITI